MEMAMLNWWCLHLHQASACTKELYAKRNRIHLCTDTLTVLSIMLCPFDRLQVASSSLSVQAISCHYHVLVISNRVHGAWENAQNSPNSGDAIEKSIIMIENHLNCSVAVHINRYDFGPFLLQGRMMWEKLSHLNDFEGKKRRDTSW